MAVVVVVDNGTRSVFAFITLASRLAKHHRSVHRPPTYDSMSDAATTSSSSAASPSGEAAAAAAADETPSPMEHRKYLLKKRKEFITHMLRSLDIITYLHISYLYFLDCNFVRFAIRCAVQFLFLTPKIINFPLPPHNRSPVVGLIGSAVLCAALHLWEDSPSAGELAQGYLHGGLIIDFIGEKGPISKSRLLYVDLSILFLQLLMLGIVVAKQDAQVAESGDEGSGEESPQDVESEERGERRREQPDTDPLLSESTPERYDGGEEMERADIERKTFEVSAGEFEVLRMDITGVIRRQWTKAEQTDDANGRTLGGPTFERSGMRWRFTLGQQTSAW